MTSETKDTTAALSQLSTDITDVIKGFDEMEKRSDPDILPIVQRLHTLHEEHSAALFTAIETMGGRPEDSGSMMGAVQVAVAAARDWFDKMDMSALPRIIEGEKRLTKSYDEAIAATSGHSGVRELLDNQRAAIEAQIDALSNA